MKIGLIDIEPKIFNTAYMQISQYHKNKGDTVGWWCPLTKNEYDHVYCSSLFDFTDKSEVPELAICGGTGFDVKSRLSKEIEACDYDYSLYPKCETSYIWFTKGCKRKCPWCVVPQKEGQSHVVRLKKLNPNGLSITVMDNDFFTNPNWEAALRWFAELNLPLDIQGVDARNLSIYRCSRLNELRLHKQIKIAWDNPNENLEPKLQEVIKYIKPYKLMCYVLIGYWSTPEEDLFRVETLRGLKIDPFVMPYNKKDFYQKRFARWVNRKEIFKTVKWEDYK